MNIGLLFPGQGAQAVGMGAELMSRSSESLAIFREASEILGFDLATLCSKGPAEQLDRTEFSQPALFVHSYAALKQLERERPDLWNAVTAVAGLSLGEYTAIAAAGGLSFGDSLRLVHARGRAMQAAADAVPSGMSSVIGLDELRLEEICRQATGEEHFVRIANLLCPGNIAISGHVQALERAEELCAEAGAMKTVRLAVAGAFHTPLMEPAAERLSDAMRGVQFQPPSVPIYSNVDALPHSDSADFPRLLTQQLVTPVQWQRSLENMLQADCDHFIEIGSGRVLAGTLKRINRKIPCENVN